MSMKQTLLLVALTTAPITSIQEAKALSPSSPPLLKCGLFSSSQDGYYIEKAKGYMREAEYYTKKAEGYDREAEYYNKKAQGYLREADY